MSPRRSDSRERMVRSAAVLLREQGTGGTSIDRVLAHSGAPRGSVYHHFPGGRTQLIDEAVRFAGDYIAGRIDTAVATDDPVGAVDAVFALWRRWLLESGFRSGCPIVAVAVEPHDDAPRLVDSAAEAFARWRAALTGLLVRHGVPQDRAARLAVLVVAALEGAVVMCRAERGIEPLDAVAEETRDLLARTLGAAPGAPSGADERHLTQEQNP
ncbi:TetR/AcrR family transcriptional regulator [Streptomyces sp. NPDC005840]|uniref:TetR/AcrR family transcriptional regulator n=1 Tax=Streptomyces sp. NPDC005840 TaxID=3157072 RepID=UPI0033C098C3